jgi:hypothetical protein
LFAGPVVEVGPVQKSSDLQRRGRKLTSLAVGSARPANARVLWRNARDVRRSEPWADYVARASYDYRQLIERSVAWLCHSQDVVGSGGVGCYEFGGWTRGYPEVTGYIIPTVWAAHHHLGSADLRRRAIRMTDWELRVQKPEGGFESFYEGDGRPPVVFNTGQALRGLLTTFRETGSDAYLDAAVRAADWIVAGQEDDGSWARQNYLGMKRVYDTYVAAPLADLANETGRADYRRAAVANCDFALAQRHHDGWFDLCDNTPAHNDIPLTHTLCYTIDGLLDVGKLVEEERYVHAARASADALAGQLGRTGRLAARFDREWKSAADYVCVTGSAQLGVILMKLEHLTGDRAYGDRARRIADFLAYVQDLNAVSVDQAGGLPGSYPIWGRYAPLKYPSWATKYFLDLLLMLDHDRASAEETADVRPAD